MQAILPWQKLCAADFPWPAEDLASGVMTTADLKIQLQRIFIRDGASFDSLVLTVVSMVLLLIVCHGCLMMRHMFVEFPGDRACETLDKQYMLGDSLLVAPIFKESGEVEYYVLEGKWQKETYDYFHMPLLVRSNAILAVGNNSDRPDYDYADGVTLYLVNLEHGKTTETAVTDLQGNTVLTVKARRDGNIVNVCVEGRTEHVTYKIMGNEELEVVVE